MTEQLILNGADIVKVGIGPGSACTTRIQTGVGFMIMAALTGIHRLNLVKTNIIKVFVVLCYTPVTLLIYICNGKVLWIFA